MRTVIISLISFAVGTLFGLGFMCCFIVAGQEDRQKDFCERALNKVKFYEQNQKKKKPPEPER